MIIDENLYEELVDRYEDYFTGGMGAEAIQTLIRNFDLDAEAEELRGDGDARAAAIYAAAYGQDQEFYAFHRSLQAYRESFSSKEDVLVLDPKSDFFRYLQSNK